MKEEIVVITIIIGVIIIMELGIFSISKKNKKQLEIEKIELEIKKLKAENQLKLNEITSNKLNAQMQDTTQN